MMYNNLLSIIDFVIQLSKELVKHSKFYFQNHVAFNVSSTTFIFSYFYEFCKSTKINKRQYQKFSTLLNVNSDNFLAIKLKKKNKKTKRKNKKEKKILKIIRRHCFANSLAIPMVS